MAADHRPPGDAPETPAPRDAPDPERSAAPPDDTVVSPAVVERIAELAVSSVAGVQRVVTTVLPPPMSALAYDVHAMVQEGRGVKAVLSDGGARLDIRIVAKYGADIRLLTKEIRRVVRRRVGELTGIAVASVRVRVVDVHAPSSESTS